MRATDHAERSAAEHADDTETIAGAVQFLARLLPAADRESILGDLVEDAAGRHLAGARRSAWLAGQCGAIAAGLSLDRARAWLVFPPVREVVVGLSVDRRGLLRGSNPMATACRALLFCGSIATLMLGVELLVSSLLTASGL